MSAPVLGGASGPVVKTEPCERPLHDELITIEVDGIKMETVPDENPSAVPGDNVSRETAVPILDATSSPVIKTEPEEPRHEDFTNIEDEGIESEEARSLLYPDHEIKEEMVIGPTEIQHPAPGLVPCHEDWAAAELAKHRRAHHTPVSLPLHGGTTATGERELDHTTTQKRRFSCEHCGKAFTRKSNLNRHLRIHTGEKPFTCHNCDKRFSDKAYLIKHLLVHTGETPFACDNCDKSFTQKFHLNNHLRVHTGEKPFACNHCVKRFTHKNTLVQHIRIHTSEKPLTCDHCNKRFTRRNSLNKHIMRIHTVGKRFHCDHCNKSFSQKDSLNAHQRLHTGEKLFTCDQCDKIFTHKAHLNKHLRIHTGEKPYVCDHCDKRFSEKGNLNKHLLRVHLSF